VGSSDTAIINAHGAKSKVAIGYQSGETLGGYNERREPIHKDKWNMLSDTRLAQTIKMDDLGTSHRIIKLNNCFGAESSAALPWRLRIRGLTPVALE
jgi:hypothetical protein